MNNSLLIIDGMNCLLSIHHYYLNKPLKVVGNAPDDEHRIINRTIRAFLRKMSMAIKANAPRYILLHFDGHDPYCRRRKIYPDYKRQKSSLPEDVIVEIRNLCLLFESMQLPCLRPQKHEFQDFISSAIAHFADEHIVIHSTNKSLLRFVSERVAVFNQQEKKLYNPELVRSDYSLDPNMLVDYWSLVGDKNIPGVMGIGELSAVKLLRSLANNSGKPIAELSVNFDEGTFEEFISDLSPSQINSHLQKKLLAGKDRWETSKQLLAVSSNLHLPPKLMCLTKGISLPGSELGTFIINELEIKPEVDDLLQQCKSIPLWQETRNEIRKKDTSQASP